MHDIETWENEGGAIPADRHGRTRKAARAKTPPSMRTLQRWSFDGIARATDGCRVEPDGTCPHGNPSWLIKLGLM